MSQKKSRNKTNTNLIVVIVVIVLIVLLGLVGSAVFINTTLKRIQNEQLNKKPAQLDSTIKTDNISLSPEQTLVTSAPKAVSNPVPSCIQYKIREGEFASDKCYSASDLSDLEYNINKLNNAVFEYNGTVNMVNVTCGGFTESFKQQCEQGKKDLDMYNKQIEEAKAAIRNSIAKGK